MIVFYWSKSRHSIGIYIIVQHGYCRYVCVPGNRLGFCNAKVHFCISVRLFLTGH